MGSGIAIAAVRAGHNAVLFDVGQEQLDKASIVVVTQLDKAVEKKKMSADTYAKLRKLLLQ